MSRSGWGWIFPMASKWRTSAPAATAASAVESGAKRLGVHVVGEPPEARVAPFRVAGRVGGPAPTAELLAPPLVADPETGQVHSQRLPRELRMAPRPRKAAHVDDSSDAAVAHDGDKLVGGPGPVPHREQERRRAQRPSGR
jgi:hypothetical protein